MSVRVLLDQHNVPFYTNLDFLSGRVVLTLNYDTAISQINVKLEGESRTRLAGPRSPYDRPDKARTELEVHKVLYKVQTVFPDASMHMALNPQFTLRAGQYEHPFQFKFPFNNCCKDSSSSLPDLKFGSLNVALASEPLRHVKKALPPTLGGFPGEADIRYFVKATVVRPKFYHENLRMEQSFMFLPIEPPRPERQEAEQYARRQHQFQPHRGDSIRKSLFRKSVVPPPDEEPLRFRIDARLPSPAIITCHRPLPLRVLVERLNDSSANLYLSTFQIELIGFTDVRAHALTRTEITSWILVSKANMDMVLDDARDPLKKEVFIPTRLWENVPVPNSVIPSFETCNLSRRYELEVRIGVTHSMPDGPRPELIVLPLRLPCEVYSGIAPPKQLLDRVKAPTALQGLAPATAHASKPGDAGALPTTPVSPVYDLTPPQLGTQQTHHPLPPHDDLPPSYEDAMAEDIAPVDGPRQHFEFSVAAQHQSPMTTGDSKSSSGGLNRHNSERLFSQNAPRPPTDGNADTNTSMMATLTIDQSNTVFEEPDSLDDIAPPLPASTTQYHQDGVNGEHKATGSLDASGTTTSTTTASTLSPPTPDRVSAVNNGTAPTDPEPPAPPLPRRKPTVTNPNDKK